MKTRRLIPVGLHLHNNNIEALWLDGNHQPHPVSIPLSQASDLERKILTDIDRYLPEDAFTLHWIGNIAPTKLWTKSLLLPASLTLAECEQQCRYTLSHELPLPLEKVWFDYCAYSVKQGVRLDIFAVVKTVVQEQLEAFSPLKLDVLDSVVHSLRRAFAFLLPQENNGQETLFLYRDEHYALAMKNTAHRLLYLQRNSLPINELWQQFCSRFGKENENCIVYSCLQEEEYQPAWQRLETELHLPALGAALWQADQKNVKIFKSIPNRCMRLLRLRLRRQSKRSKYDGTRGFGLGDDRL